MSSAALSATHAMPSALRALGPPISRWQQVCVGFPTMATVGIIWWYGPLWYRLLVRRLRLATGAACLELARALGATPPAAIRPHVNAVIFNNRSSCCCAIRRRPGCFNPFCSTQNLDRMIQMIGWAQRTLSISMYFFTCQALGDAVIIAAQRGVRVRVIGDQSMAYSKSSQLLRLVKLAIPVRFPTDTISLVHHKFCLIDADDQTPTAASAYVTNTASTAAKRAASRESRLLGITDPRIGRLQVPEQGGLLMCGSMNWTIQAITGNWENVMITSQPELVRPFAKEFDRMWTEFAGNQPMLQPKMILYPSPSLPIETRRWQLEGGPVVKGCGYISKIPELERDLAAMGLVASTSKTSAEESKEAADSAAPPNGQAADAVEPSRAP